MTTETPRTRPHDDLGTNVPDWDPHADPGESAVGSIDALGDEVRRLREANLRLTLELQIERSRHAATTSDTFTDRARRFRVSALEHSRPNTSARVASSTLSLVHRLFPTREAPAAAPWRLSRWETVAILVIVVVGILLRFVDLADTPPGVQGDEAAIAIEGQRIRRDGWIGPYSPIAAGTPTGALYAVALAQTWFGDTIHTVRLVSAFFGTLTVVALFLVTRRSFGSATGVVSAGFLATMGWHIHYSRLGFPNILWPLFVVLGLGALVEAVRGGDRRFWAAAGIILGLGVYTYNSQVIVLAMIGGYLALMSFGFPAALLAASVGLAVVSPGLLATFALAIAVLAVVIWRSDARDHRLGGLVVFAVALVIVAFPMIRYAADESNNYFGYSERLSLTNSDEWADKAGTGERIRWVAGRYVDYWDRMCCDPRFDGVDASGTVPIVPLGTVLLAAAGIVVALTRGRRTLAAVSAMIVLAIPLTSVMSLDFALRRTLIETVFLSLFAGVAVVEGIRFGWRRRFGRYAVIPLVGLIAVVSVRQNLDDYFNGTLASSEVRWVNAVEMVAASEYIAALPEGSYVYFMTDRWPFSHEIRRYFAPDAAGEDRSEGFGKYGLAYDPAKGRPVFVLVGSYEENLARLQGRYPGGEVFVSGGGANPDFVAYLPPWPSAARVFSMIDTFTSR